MAWISKLNPRFEAETLGCGDVMRDKVGLSRLFANGCQRVADRRQSFGQHPSESNARQRSLRVHVSRHADFPPPLRFLRPRSLSLASVLNGIATEQKMQQQIVTVNQTQDELSHF